MCSYLAPKPSRLASRVQHVVPNPQACRRQTSQRDADCHLVMELSLTAPHKKKGNKNNPSELGCQVRCRRISACSWPSRLKLSAANGCTIILCRLRSKRGIHFACAQASACALPACMHGQPGTGRFKKNTPCLHTVRPRATHAIFMLAKLCVRTVRSISSKRRFMDRLCCRKLCASWPSNSQSPGEFDASSAFSLACGVKAVANWVHVAWDNLSTHASRAAPWCGQETITCASSSICKALSKCQHAKQILVGSICEA